MAPALCDIAYGSYCDSLGALMAVAVILNPWAAAALTFFGTLAVIDCLDEQRKVCAKTDFDRIHEELLPKGMERMPRQ
jgi:hypothetical protein